MKLFYEFLISAGAAALVFAWTTSSRDYLEASWYSAFMVLLFFLTFFYIVDWGKKHSWLLKASALLVWLSATYFLLFQLAWYG